MRLSLFRKKSPKDEGEEKGGEGARGSVKEAVRVRKPVMLGDIPRLSSVPSKIFIGSSKGGCGKSYIASNLVTVVSALSDRKVYAVDMDLDNRTLSMIMPPRNALQRLLESLQLSGGADYLNVADVMISGFKKAPLLKFSRDVITCSGQILKATYTLIPVYHLLRQKEQQALLKNLDSRLLRQGVESLMDFFEREKASENYILVVDGKQKSNIGIEFEPLYRLMIERSDLFVLVVEPPYLVFSTETAQYRNVLDKTVIIVNKVDAHHVERVSLFVRDAQKEGVPVIIFPKLDKDASIYVNQVEPPSTDFKRKTALFTLATALFLNLVKEDSIGATGCLEDVSRIMQMYSNLMRAGG